MTTVDIESVVFGVVTTADPQRLHVNVPPRRGRAGWGRVHESAGADRVH
jgi:hypothetical protein